MNIPDIMNWFVNLFYKHGRKPIEERAEAIYNSLSPEGKANADNYLDKLLAKQEREKQRNK